MSFKFILASFTLLAALCADATTLSDNLTASTFGAEQISGTTWLTAGFRTDSSRYLLSSVTVLIEQDMPGTLNLALYSNTAMQPPNQLGYQPGSLIGTLSAPATFPSSFGQVTFSGNHLMLAPHSTYWIVMSAPMSGSFEWAFEEGESGSGVGFHSSWGMSHDSGASWFTNAEQPMQMSVIGTPVSAVPEPVAVWLVLLGVVAVMGASSREGAFGSPLLFRRQRIQSEEPCPPIHVAVS